MQSSIILYPAASLFCGRETFFNIHLVDRLEKMRNPDNSQKYRARLPQRDGFEFGNLTASLASKLSPNEVDLAVKNIIYLLDLGIFLPQSDVVVANLDEPLDPGVDIELNYARAMNKFVLGIRTDVRSPYGSSTDHVGGMHFFPAFQCDVLIRHYMPCKDIDSATREMDELARKVDAEIDKADDKLFRARTDQRNSEPEGTHIKKTLYYAHTLFEGVKDIHSQEGLEEIASIYVADKTDFYSLAPRIAT